MIHLHMSVCGELGQEAAILKELLAEFQQSCQTMTEVEVDPIPWEAYRQELTSMVIHGGTGDISQAGAPVASDLMAMNALRPFHPQELEAMGGRAAFVPAAWQSVQQMSDKQVWSIPWLADPRVLLYWRDMLESAGVDERTAFQTPLNFMVTLQRLQAGGVAKPWGINTRHKHSAIHSVASWVWAYGGDFLSEDGTRALFLEGPGQEAMKAYFGAFPYLAGESQELDYSATNRAFTERRTAVILGNGETIASILSNSTEATRAQLGAALPFGMPLVGGSNLVVWAGSRNGEAAVRLVDFLVGKKAQSVYPQCKNYLPVRAEVLQAPPYTTDPVLKSLAEAVLTGRIFPITRLSGLLEEHLGNALVNIWAALFADPQANIDGLISKHLAPVVRRYDNWMV
jgi:ABC-type glycerol-3-phosphate transport system substrate-binding protein